MDLSSSDKLKTALVVLSNNMILHYFDEITSENLPTLKVKYENAYHAVEAKEVRELLILTGLCVASYKGPPEMLEIGASSEARGPSAYYNFGRFREAMIGTLYNLRNNLPLDRRWKFDEKSVDIRWFLDSLKCSKTLLSEVEKFIRALQVLISQDTATNRRLWHNLVYSNDELVIMSSKTRQGFINICTHVEREMTRNEKRINQLLNSKL